MEVYEVKVLNLKGNFKITADVDKFNKPLLTLLPNTCFQDMIQEFSHFMEVTMNEIMKCIKPLSASIALI